MRTNWLKRFGLGLAALLVLFAAGCGGAKQNGGSSANQTSGGASQEQETIKLKLYAQYSDESETVPLDYAVEEMKKVMPNVEVEIIPEARDDNQKLKTYAAAGNLPDIYRATVDIIKTFQKSNNILQLDDYVAELGIEDRLLDSTRELLRDEDGHIYAIPTDAPWFAMVFYNKEVFEKYGVKPPENFDELLSAIAVFKENDIIPLALFAKEKWPGVQLFDMVATRYTTRGVLDLNDGKALASDEPYRKAAEKIVQLVDAGLLVPGAFNMGYDEALALFAEGKAAMLLNGGWAIQDLGTEMPGKAGILKYPFADPGTEDQVKYQMSGGAGLGGFAVSPDSKHKDIAAKYAIQLSLKMSEGRVLKRGAFPIVKDSVEPEVPYTDIQQEYLAYANQAKTSTAFPWDLSNAKVKTALEDNVQKLLTGGYAVDSFVQDMDKIIKN